MRTLFVVLALLITAASGETPALSEKAAKYHSMLLKRPKPGAIYERFTSAWLEDGDIASLKTFLEARANDAKATTADRLVLGFFLSQLSEHDAAIATFAKALEADPANAEAWLLRAQAETKVSKFEDALKSLDQVKTAQGETAVDVAKLKARLLARTGKTDAALVVLKDLAAAHPEDEDLQDEVVELHLDEGLQAEAMDFLKALLERTKDPYQRVLRRLRLGDILKRMDKRDDALAAYSQCLNDAAQDSWVESEVLAQIEQTFRSKDDVNGLKDFLAKLAETHAQRLALGQLRARVLLDLAEGEAAIALHRELLQKNPTAAALKESFIDMLARLQKFDDAVVQCRELLTQRPADKELRIHLATLMYQAKKPGEAMAELKPLVADAKTPEFELLRVARLYDGFDFQEDARKLYQRAADAWPDSVTAQDALASYMHSHNEKISAVTIWKKQAATAKVKDEVLRVARALGSRGEGEAAFEVLRAREKEFVDDAPYLSQLIAAANATQRPDLAVGWALTLVRMAKDGEALDDVLRQVRVVFRDAKVQEQTIKDLKANTSLSINERCLLAEMLEQSGDPEGADKLLAAAPASDAALAQREQAHLYTLRQDFEKAAQMLEKIAQAKKEPQVVEQLVNLLQRNASYESALKWTLEWKQLLPGSARPWMMEARLLQQQQKADESVKVLKQAARKFSDDVSMSTALAEAYAQNNQLADTQRIYQQLYDEAQDISAQMRWAGQLAETAQRRGATKELLESFQERQRSNRTSIAPWLAMAEIHRRTNNYEGRRSALLEASRLKPKDIDLLHQIAKGDEDQGEWRKAIETLSTAAALDKTDKSKQRMAEIHLRYGDEETGLRMAFELGGGDNMDPRDAEGMIISLMARGNWKSAIMVIDPLLSKLPEDYRLRYLKMICLMESDQAEAAINEAAALMDARKEVLTPSKARPVTAMPFMEPTDPDPVGEMVGSIAGSGAMALRYRQELGQSLQSGSRSFFYYGGSTSSAPQYGFIPPSISEVKPYVAALLIQAKVEQNWDAARVAGVVKRLNAAGHPVAEALEWFDLPGKNGGNLPIKVAEVAKRIDSEKLVQLWMTQLQGPGLSGVSAAVLMRLQASGVKALQKSLPATDVETPELLNKIFDHYQGKPDPITAVQAAIKLWQLDPKNTAKLDQAVAMAAKLPVKEPTAFYAYMLPLSNGSDPSANRTVEGRKLRDAAAMVVQRYLEAHPEQKNWRMVLPGLHARVGDWEAFVTSVNEVLADPNRPKNNGMFYFGGSWSLQIQALQSYQVFSTINLLPMDVMGALMPRSYGMGAPEPMPKEEAEPLLKAAARLTNEEVRAFIAWRAGDHATFDAFADKQKAADKPLLWPLLARALELGPTDSAAACSWLQKARTVTTDRDKLAFINAAFVHAVTSLKKEGKDAVAAPFLKDAQTALLALRRSTATGSAYEIEQVLRAMESLEMKDEVERQKKLLAAAQGTQRRSSSAISGSSTDPYHIVRDIREGNQATAIPQAVRALRTLANTVTGSNNMSSFGYQLSQWKRLVREQPKAAEEVWKQLSTGEASTIKAKIERGLLAETLGHDEVAESLYAEAVKVKPRDAMLRYRLAMLLMRKQDDTKAALEHLLAVSPSDLNSIAENDYSRFDGESDLRERVRYARLVVSYFQQVKAKAKPEDLLWCGSAADILISGQWIGSTFIPSLLDEDAEKHESTKERQKVLEEFYQATVDQPRISLHVLPAVFALAVRDKADTAPLTKQARATLTAVAANRDGGVSYSSNESWEENYNGSISTRRIWAPQVPEMLLYDAHQRKAEKEFHDEIVPLIRLAYSVDVGTEFDQRARLWFCPEGEFLEAAKAMKVRAVRSGRNDSNPSGVIRVWSERGLQVSLAELLADYVSEQMRKGYGIDDNVIVPYVKGLMAKGGRDALIASLKQCINAALGKPESEWKDFLAKNPPPPRAKGSSSRPSPAQGSPLQRLQMAMHVSRAFARGDTCAWMEVVTMLNQADFNGVDQFGFILSLADDDTLPTKATDLMPSLERTPWLKDLPDFDPVLAKEGGYYSAFETLARHLNKGRDYASSLVDALQKRQEQKRTLGAALLMGKLTEFAPDMTIALAPQAPAFAALPAERKDVMLKLFRSVWPGFDRDVLKSCDLDAFAGATKQTKLKQAQKLLAAKTTKDFDSSDRSFETSMPQAVADALPLDPGLAQRAFDHGIELLVARVEKKDWDSNSWFNGFNRSSGMLERVCKKVSAYEKQVGGKPSLDSIAFGMRLLTRPDQRLFVTGTDESDTEWGSLLRTAWERSGGYPDPRKATRDVLTELHRAMGATSPALLSVVMQTMVHENMPRWYRAVIMAEAKQLATNNGPLKAIATELVAGIGLELHEPEAARHLLQRIQAKGEPPLVRAMLAGRLMDAMAAELKPEELRLCCDPIIAVLETDGPGTAPLWLPFLTVLNQQAEAGEWKPVIERTRTAWLHRARFNKDGNKAPLRFEPTRSVAPAVLELFARSKDEKALLDIYNSTPKAFEGNVETPLVLARYGRTSLLKRSLKGSDGNANASVEVHRRTIKFSAQDKEVLHIIDETLKDDPRLARRARVYAATAMDSTTDPADVRRNERLKLEAERFVADRKVDPKIDDKVVKHLIDSVPAAQVLAPALLPEVKWDALIASSTQGNNRVSENIEVPVTLALTAALAGDDAAWKALLAGLEGKTSGSLQSALSFRIATAAMALARHHGWPKTDAVMIRLREFMAALPDGASKPNDINNIHLVLALLSGRGDDFDQWRKALSSNRQTLCKPFYSDWFEYVLESMPMTKDEDGGKTVVTLLKHPLSRDLTLSEVNFDYKGRWPKRFDDESLRKHTKEILEADPGNKAALDAVMNAWVSEKNPQPLLDAIKAVKPKCDKSKHSVALERMSAIEAEWGNSAK